MSDRGAYYADKLNEAVDQIEAAREQLKQEFLRQQSLMKKGDVVYRKPLDAIYKSTYALALKTLQSLPPETPGLREAVGVFLVGDLGNLQAAGMTEPEKLLQKSMDVIMQEQVKFAYLAYERQGRSVASFATLLAVYTEALGIGIDQDTLFMKKAKVLVQKWANDLKL
jgi:hypothetical protein